MSRTRTTVAAASFTALIAVGAYLSIPIGPVPLVLQNFFVLLSGLLLGPLHGSMSVAMYLFIGAAGLPVFAGASGGIAHFFGPTGGYLIGFLPAAFVSGLLASRIQRDKLIPCLAALTAGTICIFALGVPWLKLISGFTWSKSIAVGLLPFIPGELLKVTAAAFTARSLSGRVDEFLQREG
jgi:biotin transport system substrate-specific component